MRPVHRNLFVGALADFAAAYAYGYRVVQACKDPCHREALGYTGRDPDRGDPEFYVALRERRLILNLTDARDPKYIWKPCIIGALRYIADSLNAGAQVLIHCNEGRSRAPSIAMLYLAMRGVLGRVTYEQARWKFSQLYPRYEPGPGMDAYLRQNWTRLMERPDV